MLKPFRCHNYSVACELPSVYVNKEATWKLKKTQIFFSLIRVNAFSKTSAVVCRQSFKERAVYYFFGKVASLILKLFQNFYVEKV